MLYLKKKFLPNFPPMEYLKITVSTFTVWGMSNLTQDIETPVETPDQYKTIH